ncbi:MAG TPA: radical SAM family heme chaperone HemW [Myxococcota bacterium]|nr:radical SAM family heme chaperone HemW [Myxococcota bacterium]
MSRARPEAPIADRDVGVYLHVPFCERVCPYCDFAVEAARPLAPEREDEYVAALLAELAARRGDFAGLALATIYLGGGTPSLLEPRSVARLVAAVRDAFDGAAPGEVTLEVNPSTVERARLPGFREAGVDRLSVGVQSFDDLVLRRLGRAHRAEEGHATLAAARSAGFERISLDLILGVPDQSDASLDADLDAVADFAPEHVSAYGLTFEPGTPFGRARDAGRIVPPPDDRVADLYERVGERLAAAGLPRYEISSHARPGGESRHNRRYWQRRPVLGLGVGAWSSEPRSGAAPHGARRHNLRGVGPYLARVAAGASPQAGETEVLAPAAARGEAVFLALRTREGLDPAGFETEFGAPPERFFGPALDALGGAGLVERGGGRLRLTPRGRLLSDSVFEHFV